MKLGWRFHFILFFLLFFLLFTMAATPSLFAQSNDENWLEAAANGRLTIQQLSGRQALGAHPVLRAVLENPSADSAISVRIAPGDILRPSTPGYCSILIAGIDQPILLAAGEITSQELTVYCLELPDTVLRPDEMANYLPPNVSPASQAPSTLREILSAARQANLLEDYATQLAIWQQFANLADFTELSNRLGQNDLERYREPVAWLTNNTTLPPLATETAANQNTPTRQPTTVVENAAAVVVTATTESTAAEDNNNSSGGLIIDPNSGQITVGSNLVLVGIGGGAFCLLTLALFFMAFRTRAPAPSQNRRREPQIGQSTPTPASFVDGRASQNDFRDAGPSAPHCKICRGAHDERICPERRLTRAGGFGEVKADDTVPTVGKTPTPKPSNPRRPEVNQPSRSSWGSSSEGHSGARPRPQAAPASSASQAKPHASRPVTDDSFYEQTGHPHMNDGDVSAITEPTVGPSAPASPAEESTPKNPTELNSAPPVTYVISDDQNRRYLNGNRGLLARDDLSTRQIVLSHDPTVSTPHAVIRFEPSGRVTVRDLHSTNNTLVDNKALPIGKAIALKHNSQIRFGTKSEYQIDLQQRKLVSISGNQPEIDLSQENLWVITRHPSPKTISFDNRQLSNPHLLIRPGDSDRPLSFKLRDLGSSNGTFINGHDLRQMRDGTFIAEEEVEIQVGRGGRRYTIKVESIKTAFKSGDLIGKQYRVEKRIYNGVMSELYLVTDNNSLHGKSLAAKIPYTQKYGEEKVLAAFKREIELMADPQFRHSNLLSAEDSYQATNSHDTYLIMPHIEGENLQTLQERLRERQSEPVGLRLADIKALFDQLLSALEYLHDNRWIHCDLKPDNILLSKDGQVFLIDLGAATATGKHADFRNRAYSAPETGSARVVNEASDIYSLGKILFELITGQNQKLLAQLPASQASLQGDFTPQSTAVDPDGDGGKHLQLHKIFENPPHGGDFAHLINKATAQKPIDRYPDVEALRNALEDAYTRPMSQAALNQEGPADLAKLMQELNSKHALG